MEISMYIYLRVAQVTWQAIQSLKLDFSHLYFILPSKPPRPDRPNETRDSKKMVDNNSTSKHYAPISMLSAIMKEN